MNKIVKYCLLLMVLALLLPMRQISATPLEPVSDIRVLIDVSGSMKKTDPNNLRGPALRMLVGLMPSDGKAGVWTFAKFVNMQVPWRDVNEAWRSEAEKQSHQIHSYGLFTNIEQVLQKASVNLDKPDPRYRRSIILLSDGMVDIAKDSKPSQQSRQRILEEIAPRLKKAKVAVHTVALSEHADHELLRALSLATDGWYQQVNDATELQRVFLHMFEKSAQRDTVPLNDNRFVIDSSVSEMTILVFRKQGSRAAELVLPDNTIVSHQTPPSNFRWHSEASYDLITIDAPVAGNWRIDADIDPDNRVMVVTDLKLQTTDLPNNILIGETFDIEASLTEKDEIIVRQDFLKLVDASMLEENEIDAPPAMSLNDAQQQGIYRSHVGESFQPGRNDVVITMKSATFERQRRQSINVVDMPFTVNVTQLPDAETRTHKLSLKPDVSLIKTENLTVTALLTADDGSEWSYEVIKTENDEWQLTLADLMAGEKYSLALQIRGETLKGRSLFLQPSPLVLEDLYPPLSEAVQETDPQVEATAEEAVEQEETEQAIEQDEAEQEPVIMVPDDELETEMELFSGIADGIGIKPIEMTDDESAMSSTMKLAIGNIVILLLVAGGIFFWRRQSQALNKTGDML